MAFLFHGNAPMTRSTSDQQGSRRSKTIDFGQLAVSSKTLWLRNVSEPLNGEKFRDPKLRRKVRLKVNAVAKAVRWLDGADAECWEN
jgi:hypothetical protein